MLYAPGVIESDKRAESTVVLAGELVSVPNELAEAAVTLYTPGVLPTVAENASVALCPGDSDSGAPGVHVNVCDANVGFVEGRPFVPLVDAFT